MSSNANLPNSHREASLSAQDTYTVPGTFGGTFMLRIRGTWVGTITLERSDDQGVNFDQVEEFVDNDVRIGAEVNRGGATYRLGFATGNYTSGTADVRLG